MSLLLQLSSEFLLGPARNQSHLVELLLANQLIRNPATAQALRSIDRALFLPTKDAREYREPYSNKPQALGFGCNMSSPSHHALVLDELFASGRLRSGARVLDMGTGSGYLAAAFATVVLDPPSDSSQSGSVVGVERVPQLLDMAKQCIKACPATSAVQSKVRFCSAYLQNNDSIWNLAEIAGADKEFDVVHCGFSLDSKHDDIVALLGLLAPDGVMMIGRGADLVALDKLGKERVISRALLQPMERGTYVPLESRLNRVAKAKQQLDVWRSEFANKRGRSPSRKDLEEDEQARLLFAEFSRLTRLGDK